MGQAIGLPAVLVDRDSGSAQSHPPAHRVLSELDFIAAGFDECSLVVMTTPSQPHEQAVERRRSRELYAWTPNMRRASNQC